MDILLSPLYIDIKSLYTATDQYLNGKYVVYGQVKNFWFVRHGKKTMLYVKLSDTVYPNDLQIIFDPEHVTNYNILMNKIKFNLDIEITGTLQCHNSIPSIMFYATEHNIIQ